MSSEKEQVKVLHVGEICKRSKPDVSSRSSNSMEGMKPYRKIKIQDDLMLKPQKIWLQKCNVEVMKQYVESLSFKTSIPEKLKKKKRKSKPKKIWVSKKNSSHVIMTSNFKVKNMLKESMFLKFDMMKKYDIGEVRKSFMDGTI